MDRSSENSSPIRKIKKESADDDMNEFAETAMNEMLGWYGYGTNCEDRKILMSAYSSHHGSNSSDPESPKYADSCEWCGKLMDENKNLSSTGGTFCSELCFSQSRRANFKKNKTCDWCRHVRHTVSYVDFQDGASQLQFCSDKCLNQYKMHIFCRETRAHLEMHPHLPDSGSSGTLITPDMWLKNCKSPEPSSGSPSLSPKIKESISQNVPLSLIKATHSAKIINCPNNNKIQRIKTQKTRKRCTSTVTCSPPEKSPLNIEIPQDLRVRHTPPVVNVQLKDDQGQSPLKSTYSDIFKDTPLINSFISGPRLKNSIYERLVTQPQPSLPLHPPSYVDSLLPPATMLIPYPIIIPLPLPIPIPIPIPCEKKSKENDKNDADLGTDVSRNQNKVDSNVKSHLSDETKHQNTTECKENGVSDVPEKEGEDKKTESDLYLTVVNGAGGPYRKRKRVMEVNSKCKKTVPV